MKSIVDEERASTAPKWENTLRRFWPLILFLTLCLVLGVWTLINQGQVSPTKPVSKPAAAKVSKARPKQPVSDDQRLRTSIPTSLKATARRVVETSLEWSKTNGVEHCVVARKFEEMGMASSLASSYKPMWSHVFAPARSATLNAQNAQVSVADGPVGPSSAEYVVTVRLSPSWVDRHGKHVSVDPGSAEWTVTVDLKAGKVIGFSEPAPKWLWFALPSDGLKPSEKPVGGSL